MADQGRGGSGGGGGSDPAAAAPPPSLAGPPTLRALCTAFIAEAAAAGAVGSLGDLPSELIPPLVASVTIAAALATIADETAAHGGGRSLAAELDSAWARLFAADFGGGGGRGGWGGGSSGPSSAKNAPAWRRRYEAEAARRAAALAAAAARVRARFEAEAAAARARGVVVLARPPPGRGRGRGRGRPDPFIPAPARLLAKLGRLPEARAVVARAEAKRPAVFMRQRAGVGAAATAAQKQPHRCGRQRRSLRPSTRLCRRE